MKTTNYLEKIIATKQAEVDRLIEETKMNPGHPLNRVLQMNHPQSEHFSKALKNKGLSVIAEVKRRSPSCGELRSIDNPARLAIQYCHGGASAISVLTDSTYFGGSLSDLNCVSEALSSDYPNVAVLRKDFIIHPLQLAEAVKAGAHAVLLIVSVVGKDLKFLMEQARRLGLEVLTEVHDLSDLETALEVNAPIIGINHRNLITFEMDLTISETLMPLIPNSIITVAESGIHQPLQARSLRKLGFDAILAGEALVRSNNPELLIQKMKGDHDEG